MVNPDPLISIIIPTYNAKHWIGQTLQSILTQPNPETYEVIVIDDGSTDGTQELIQRDYAGRVHYYYQSNQGRGASRNAGLKVARGAFIQFFDADDIMEANALQPRFAFLCANPQYAAAYGHAVLFWDGNPQEIFETNNQQRYCSGDIIKSEIHTPFLWLITVLFRKEWADRVGGMDETLKSNEDWHFWLKIAAKGGLFAYVDGAPVARYRARYNNPIESVLIHQLSGIQVLERIKPLLVGRADYKNLELNKAIGAWRYGYGYSLMKFGDVKKGHEEILQSLIQNHQSITTKLFYFILSYIIPITQVENQFFRLRRLVRSFL